MSERLDIDLRSIRARQFTAQMMDLLKDVIPADKRQEAQDTLFQAAYDAEIEVTTRDSRRLGALRIDAP